jgi:hypothetical protein
MNHPAYERNKTKIGFCSDDTNAMCELNKQENDTHNKGCRLSVVRAYPILKGISPTHANTMAIPHAMLDEKALSFRVG